ncbi:pyridoxamine 5'-phosphate oxidase family protein [uncultured Ruminococcus sp.]|uniref:pyridoxamine 5'-phosphate oxidase family protein n=1 Tax=uncultured Ruminococcus sp. TaxID=165186 RepID=UPI00260AA9F4|nr:pyridoxamine 5'-phosphate oxidase family protein [uncultured Ruminococcus sp.]
MAYESVIGRGHIRILSEEEKLLALKLLMAHYHDGKDMSFNTAAIPRTLVYALEVESVTGKRKPVKQS